MKDVRIKVAARRITRILAPSFFQSFFAVFTVFLANVIVTPYKYI